MNPLLSFTRAARIVPAVLIGLLVCTPLAALPKRLILKGNLILDESLRPIQLRGGNLKVPDDNVSPRFAAADLKNNLGMNIVRLPVEFKYLTPDDPEGGFSTIDEFGDLIDERTWSVDVNGFLTSIEGSNGIIDVIEFTKLWVDELVAQGIWVQFEARVNDADSTGTELYDCTTPSTRFLKFQAFWVAFANAFKDTDYIAGYGIVAEPSAIRHWATAPDAPVPEPVTTLTTFQLAIMNKINASTASGGAGDTWTPFWVGADGNYFSFEYLYEDYNLPALAYPNRVVYVVNFLVPRPWITNGLSTDDVAISYPKPAPPNNDFSFLLTRSQSEITANNPEWWELKKIFFNRSEDATYRHNVYNREYMTWYLNTYALPFAAANDLPFVVDQFGASSAAEGYLIHERDLIDVMETYGLHWTRWGYNAGNGPRRLDPGNEAHDYYSAIGTRIHAGELVGHATAEIGTTSTVHLRAEHYTEQAPSPTDGHRWQFDATAGALENRALRAVPNTGGTGSLAAEDAPRLDFRINFSETVTYPATYYVWLRMRDGGTTNGAWFGVDETPGPGKLASATPTTWSWVNRLSNDLTTPAQVIIPNKGFHDFSVWMNKADVAVDEVILTTDVSFNPNTGGLPAYSTRSVDLPSIGSPLPPTVPTATLTGTSAVLSWTQSTGGACIYKVKRSTVSGGPYTLVASPTTTSYTNTGLANGTTYYYVISTVNSAGESANSAQVKVTTPTTVTFASVGAEDGWMLESNSTSGVGGSVNANDTTHPLKTGDGGLKKQVKSLLSFNTALPTDAVVTAATLKMKRKSLTNNPYSLGTLKVDIKTGTFLTSALQIEDFSNLSAPATQVDVVAGGMSLPTSDGAFSTGALNADGRGAINRSGKTQFRVYFSIDNGTDNTADFATWRSGNDTTVANRPVLEVTYQYP